MLRNPLQIRDPWYVPHIYNEVVKKMLNSSGKYWHKAGIDFLLASSLPLSKDGISNSGIHLRNSHEIECK
jgi:hypothetical protein